MTAQGEQYSRELARYIQRKMAAMKQEKAQHGEDYRGDELVVMLGTQAIHHATVEILRRTYGEGITFLNTSVLNELR